MESYVVPGLKEAAAHAINNNDWKPVRALLEGTAPKDSVEYTQLQQIHVIDNIIEEACSKGFTELVSVFLKSGFPVYCIVCKSTGERMLHLAAINGHLSLIKFLLNVGADVDCKLYNGDTPLLCVVQHNHIELRKHSFIVGTDISTFNSINTDIPLHNAVTYSNILVMQLLLDYGADINITDQYGNTALSIAVLRGNLQVVKFLIEHGSKINISNMYQQTPLSQCIRYAKYDIAMLLISSGADLNLCIYDRVLHTAVRAQAPLHMIECLLEGGANVTAVCEGITALQEVISNMNYISNENKLQVAKLLLIYGSNHHVKDYLGNTVLHWACKIGDLELVEYLIYYGLNVDSKNIEGKKPYDIAIEEGHTNIVKAIIHYHCNKYTSF